MPPPVPPALSHGKARARSVIQLWMGGGPSHLDTFDPKPQAGEDFCGPYRRPIPTTVPGMVIGQMLPLLARQAQHFSIIRSMTHGNNGHETATYIVQTGTLPSTDLVYPATGAVVAYRRHVDGQYQGALPPYITLTTPLGRFSEAGFLGLPWRTFATGGDPSARDFVVEGLQPPREVTEERLRNRRAMLAVLDKHGPKGAEGSAQLVRYRQEALALLGSPATRAFDLSQEKEETRNRYGRHRFGQSCLLARRLVEAGVPWVTVNFGGWDTHREHFAAMGHLLPMLDSGFATLLEDLAARGLLDSTIVVWTGEFGRTPRIATEAPWNGGRHHWGAVFSNVVAGGGFKGGVVVGASDNRGQAVKERPVYPWDLAASMYQLLGIDPQGRLPHPQGCVALVTPQASGNAPSGGMLKEIM